jgi:hypothetical protein
MAGGVFLTVTRGDSGWLCHDDDVLAYRDRRGSIRGTRAFLRCCGLAWAIDEE